jgi:hypothetical protein
VLRVEKARRATKKNAHNVRAVGHLVDYYFFIRFFFILELLLYSFAAVFPSSSSAKLKSFRRHKKKANFHRLFSRCPVV